MTTHAEWSRYHLAERDLPDGRVGVVFPLTFSRARLGVVAARGAMQFLDTW